MKESMRGRIGERIGCVATIVLMAAAAWVTDYLLHSKTLAIVVGLAVCIVCGLTVAAIFGPK